MSHEPCTLFWPRSGFTPTPGRPMLPVALARLALATTVVAAMSVPGHSNPVVDRAAPAVRIEPRSRADRVRRHRGNLRHRLGAVARVGDERRPILELIPVAALAHEGFIHQAFGHDHMGE